MSEFSANSVSLLWILVVVSAVTIFADLIKWRGGTWTGFATVLVLFGSVVVFMANDIREKKRIESELPVLWITDRSVIPNYVDSAPAGFTFLGTLHGSRIWPAEVPKPADPELLWVDGPDSSQLSLHRLEFIDETDPEARSYYSGNYFNFYCYSLQIKPVESNLISAGVKTYSEIVQGKINALGYSSFDFMQGGVQ